MEQKLKKKKTERGGIPFQLKDIQVARDGSEKRGKLYYSDFHLTLNSNQKEENPFQGKQIASELKRAIRKTFRDNGAEAFKMLVDGHKFNKEYIKSVKISYATEEGSDPRGGRVHLHALVQVEHWSKIQIDTVKSRELIREQLTTPWIKEGMYYHVEWVPSSKPLKFYLQKDPLSTMDDLLGALPSLKAKKK